MGLLGNKFSFSLFSFLLLIEIIVVVVEGAPKIDPTAPTPPPNVPSALCPQGLSFKSDCNSCFCNPKSGVTGCTLMACPTSQPLYYYVNAPPSGSGSSGAPPPPPGSTASRFSRDDSPADHDNEDEDW